LCPAHSLPFLKGHWHTGLKEAFQIVQSPGPAFSHRLYLLFTFQFKMIYADSCDIVSKRNDLYHNFSTRSMLWIFPGKPNLFKWFQFKVFTFIAVIIAVPASDAEISFGIRGKPL